LKNSWKYLFHRNDEHNWNLTLPYLTRIPQIHWIKWTFKGFSSKLIGFFEWITLFFICNTLFQQLHWKESDWTSRHHSDIVFKHAPLSQRKSWASVFALDKLSRARMIIDWQARYEIGLLNYVCSNFLEIFI